MASGVASGGLETHPELDPPPPSSPKDVAAVRAYVQSGPLFPQLGLDAAPFCVQAEAPMHLVHFYFSQLTLNCVFVTDRGQFVGMINRSDMMHLT